MKETTTINISGIIFHIDEDAFAQLKAYFSELKKRFGNTAEGKEIISDIELRIAEILQEKLTDKKQVINFSDVEEIIETMGTPENIDAGAEEDDTDEEPSPKAEYRDRRLFRDPDNKVLGGVCSGIGHYFGIDPVLIRVITVIITVFYGVGFLVYLVMWAFIPQAQTTAEKLEMKGEPVNAKNIKRKIRENYDDVKNSGAYRKARDGASQGAVAVGEVGKFILRALVIIIGIGMLIGAVASIVVMANLIFFHSPAVYLNGEIQGIAFPAMEAFFESKLTLIVFFFSSLLLGLIPIMLVLFLGVKLVFNFNTNNKAIGFSALGIWLIALAAVITIGISLGTRFSYPVDVAEKQTLKDISANTLYIEVSDLEPEREENFGDLYYGTDVSTGHTVFYERPDFDVRRSRTDHYELRIVKEARGRNRQDATQVAKAIDYQFDVSDSVLRLDPWYKVGLEYLGRSSDLDITLYVPKGQKVFFDKDIYPVVYDIENINHISDFDMMGRTWIMGRDVLEPIP